MIKLIATDLDGTLMAADHMTVTPRTVNALKAAADRGIKIAIATGRPMALIDAVIDQVPFVDYIIYSNGACVYDTVLKKVIYSDLIDSSAAFDLVKFLLENEVFFEVYLGGRSYYQLGTEKWFKTTQLPNSFINEVIKTMTACEDLSEYVSGKGVEKITLYCLNDESGRKFADKFSEYGLAVASSFPGNVEATAATADKGRALKGICDLTGIDAGECMSFGDAGNDIPMLRFAGISFAMANATEECKAAAKAVTLSNSEDGLAAAVEKYALA